MVDIQDSLLPVFIEEMQNGLEQIIALVDAFEQGAVTFESLEEARRAAHTIKGTAALVKRFRSSSIAKDVENFLDDRHAQRVQLTVDDIARVRTWYQQLLNCLELARQGQSEEADREQNEESIVHLSDDVKIDLINDFALPFMMKLHQATGDDEQLVRPACCRFYVAGRQYYVSIEYVFEIAEKSPFAQLPYSPDYIVGLFNLRGNVVPVVDLSILEGRGALGQGGAQFLVIAGDGTERIAFLSDSIPNLSLKTAGHPVHIPTFVEQYSIKA